MRTLVAASTKGAALFLGTFTLLNLLVESFSPGFDGNLWWIDLSGLASYVARPFLAILALVLVMWALRPSMSTWRRRLTVTTIGVATGGALLNCVGFYRLLADEAIPLPFPLPFSLFVALVLGSIAFAAGRGLDQGNWRRSRRAGAVAVGFVASAVIFPLMQMICFGPTDYRRHADAVVVFGARAYADGSPSRPLADRVRTACELYHEGLVPLLIFSGGPADGAMHETRSMQQMAIALGVPPSAIILDSLGLDTRSTVRNTVPMLRRLGARRVMAVSNFYHLPRVKMAYQQMGLQVYTVPALEETMLPGLPLYMGREVLGLWGYWILRDPSGRPPVAALSHVATPTDNHTTICPGGPRGRPLTRRNSNT